MTFDPKLGLGHFLTKRKGRQYQPMLVADTPCSSRGQSWTTSSLWNLSRRSREADFSFWSRLNFNGVQDVWEEAHEFSGKKLCNLAIVCIAVFLFMDKNKRNLYAAFSLVWSVTTQQFRAYVPQSGLCHSTSQSPPFVSVMWRSEERTIFDMASYAKHHDCLQHWHTPIAPGAFSALTLLGLRRKVAPVLAFAHASFRTRMWKISGHIEIKAVACLCSLERLAAT